MIKTLSTGPLPLARPLDEERPVRREALRLRDGYETSVYVHEAGGSSTRLPVLQVHGIQSHPGWFAGSAAALAGAGHPVYQVVRRGCGCNEADRGHAPSAGQLMEDVGSAGRLALERSGARGLHLLGVSWGGMLLASYTATRGGDLPVASLTLVTPGIVPRVDVSVATKLAIAACLLVAPRRTFAIPLGEAALFTDDEAMRGYIRGDSCSLRRATARFLLASRRLVRTVRRAPAGAITVPTTLMLASRDRIIDSDATRSVVERLVAGALTTKQFDAAHTLEFEADPAGYTEALEEAASRGRQAYCAGPE